MHGLFSRLFLSIANSFLVDQLSAFTGTNFMIPVDTKSSVNLKQYAINDQLIKSYNLPAMNILRLLIGQ
ncbi:hypothetical protein WH47_04153 [Habropoda laboriosa]|uniref:Uncharacterized protein n=1 Tax=Habropoda laboriosa TaxID=597456 RepID=A0A0L7QV26_9HYME|nr:hypothetical protein WH47_04153 [Habropoda laboriosa]